MYLKFDGLRAHLKNGFNIYFSQNLINKMKKKTQNKLKQRRIGLVVAVVLILALGILSYLSPQLQVITNTQSSTTSVYQPANCGDLQISVNSVREAAAYYRFGIQKPATSNYKFVILSLTVTNKGNAAKDFSGFRLNLETNDNTTYSPTQFNSIEKITLQDNSIINYNCDELALASISRLVLGAGESATGCKIYLTLNNLNPVSLLLYDTSGLKCTVKI